MPRFIRRVIAIALVLVASCVGGVRAQSAPSIYPSGLTRENVRDGLYPGTDPGNCCWMGPAARLRVTVPPKADTLLFNVYLPPFAREPGGETLRARIGSMPEQRICCIAPGERELAFHLPPGARGTIEISLRADRTFVPKERGLNDDPRALSILIRDVAFLNARSGERFDPAPKPWLPPRVAFVLLALAGLVIFGATLRRPIYGLAALLLTDPFLIAAYVHGTTITLPKVTLIAVAAALLPRALRGGLRASPALVTLAAAQFAVVISLALSTPHAAQHAPALRELLKGAQYLATLLVAYAAYRLDPDERIARVALVTVALAVMLPALAQERLGAPQAELIGGHTVPRIAGPLEGPNQLAGFLGLIVPMLAVFALRRDGRAFERAAAGFGIFACALTFSRAGFVSLLIALALLLAIALRPALVRRAAAATLGLYLAASLAAFAAFAGAAPLQALFAGHGDAFAGGLGSRTELWSAAFRLWRAHPLLGIGPGNFELAVGRFVPGVRTHANSAFFQALAEQGLLGLATYAGLVAASIGAFVRRANEPLALGACLGSIALAFHQIVDCMALYPKVGVMWFILLGMGAAALARHEHEGARDPAIEALADDRSVTRDGASATQIPS